MTDPFDLIACVLQTPGALPPLLWGTFGIGKSQRMEQLVEDLDLGHLEIVIASIREPSDFSGLPVPENGGVKFEPPRWALNLAKASKGIVVFDEISCAPPACQAGLLRVILEGWVGDLKMPETVLRMGIANPPDEAAGGWDLAYPLANRFWHYHWENVDTEKWRDWLCDVDSAIRYPKIDRMLWNEEWKLTKPLVAGFISSRPGLLRENEKAYQGRFPPAIARPRTWECAARLYTTAKILGKDDELTAPLVIGALGEPVALEFLTWLKGVDLPDIDELLRNPEKYKPDNKRQDVIFATLMSAAQKAIEDTKKWENAWKLLEVVLRIGKDLVVVPARRLVKNAPKGGISNPIVQRVAKEIGEIALASGIVQ